MRKDGHMMYTLGQSIMQVLPSDKPRWDGHIMLNSQLAGTRMDDHVWQMTVTLTFMVLRYLHIQSILQVSNKEPPNHKGVYRTSIWTTLIIATYIQMNITKNSIAWTIYLHQLLLITRYPRQHNICITVFW